MNSEEYINKDPKGENRNRIEVEQASRPIKVSDDSDSKEILVFTSNYNVYKVKRSEISDKFQALQKIEFEPGERPIYLTGEKKYKGYLIVAFENGKIGKIPMDSFQTEFNRKKLKNAYNNESRLIFIELIETDIDLVAVSSIKKIVLFNTSQINAVGSRTTKGVQVIKPKAGSSMLKVKRLEQTNLSDPEYYRRSDSLNAVGFYIKQGDVI